MTITTTNWRAGFAALLATGVLLLGACSDGDDDAADDETTDEAEDQSAAEGETPDEPSLDPDAPAADSEFCTGFLEATAAAGSPDGSADDGGLAAAEALDPPDEIAEEWDRLIATSREMAELDPEDPASVERATAAAEDLAGDQSTIMEYLQTQCGMDPSAGGPDPTTGG